MDDDYPAIGDYALVGDCRSAALISNRGAVEWLCWPRFDSPSLFAAVLDRQRGGRFAVHPTAPFTTTRRYVGDTAVLETTFEVDGGRLQVTDVMPVRADDLRSPAWPQRELLRRIECTRGLVEVEVWCDPAPDYARRRVPPRRRGALGWAWDTGDLLLLRSDVPLERAEQGVLGRATLRMGDVRWCSLGFTRSEPAVAPPLGEAAEDRLAAARRWWTDWTAQCRYDGPFAAAVRRSAVTLKLMTFSASGAVVAAPTTSLPEDVGGVRNWDYRYCWLRDASFTLRALFDLGYDQEGRAFLNWLLHATHLTRPELQVMYNIYGRTDLQEEVLDHLEGYRGSRPVRVGNAASDQLQLDLYGEVVDGVYQYVRRGGTLSRSQSDLVAAFGKVVRKRWEEPDEGIWEIRGDRRHHTYSKAMCWVALDRLLRLEEGGHLHTRIGEEDVRATRDAIRRAVETHGYDDALDSYVSVFGGDDVDASLLMLGLYEYTPLRTDRFRSTFARVEERLGRDGLLLRYPPGTDDGLPGEEGTFGLCAFWAAECEALAGDVDAATARIERLLGCANDVGLFAEEIDAATGAALGNFPQAFTHVGLINAALALANARAAVPEAGAGHVSPA